MPQAWQPKRPSHTAALVAKTKGTGKGPVMKEELNNLRGIAIARVSSKEQIAGYSIDAQKKPIIEYCQRKGIQLVQTFEFWESAGKKERKQFNAAIQFLLENELQHLVVEKTDRLYRNFRDYVLIEDLIEKHNVVIHFVKEGETFDKNSNSHAKVIHGFKVLMAKSYLDNLSEEVKKGQNQKAEKGHHPNAAPFGYYNNPDTKLIEIDAKQGKVVKKIFKMYATGRYSVKQIAIRLNKQGYVNKRGRRFHHSTIHRILTNPVHYGDFKFRGQVFKGKHEPIVSYDLWKYCNDLLQGKCTNPMRNRQKFHLSGLLWNEFDRKYTAEVQKGYIYYSATIPNMQKRTYLRQETIVGKIAKEIECIRWSDIFATQVQGLARTMLKEEKEFLAANIKQTRSKIDELTNQKKRLLDLYIAEGVEREEYLESRRNLTNELKELNLIVERHRQGDADFEAKLTDLVDTFLHLPSEFATARIERKAKIISKLASRVTLKTDKTVQLEWHQPYAQFITPEITLINKKRDAAMVSQRLVLRTLQDAIRTVLWAA